MAAMRNISPSEFVRRLKHSIVSHDTKVVWFLGAGCSVSSGVADAGTLATRWLKELKYLETGDADGLEDWAEMRFPTYDREDPAAVYIQVHEALFYTDQDQQREQDTLSGDGQPGFGYATLAQLLTHEEWGARCNTIITTNFDDLAADALYFYSQRKPQVLTHESFDRHVQVSDARPTIVKLYGDAHLGSEYLDGNRRLLRGDVKNRLRALATECTLVFVGYGGRDECIHDLFEEMPQGAPSGGVFWVNDKAPGAAMAGWLEDRRAVWAKNESFDDLMYQLRQEFKLGHPRIDRFDQVLQKYDEQYRAIASKNAPKPKAEAAPVAPDLNDTPPQIVSDTYAEATAEQKAYPVASEPEPETQDSAAVSDIPDDIFAHGPLKAGVAVDPVAEDTAPPAAEQPAAAAEVEPEAEPEIEILDPVSPETLKGEPLVAAAIAMKARATMDAPPQIDDDGVIHIDTVSTGTSASAGASEIGIGEVSYFATPEAEDIDVGSIEGFDTVAETDDRDDAVQADTSDAIFELDEELPDTGDAPAADGSRHKIDALVAAAVKAMATNSEGPSLPVDMAIGGDADAAVEEAQAVETDRRAAPKREPSADVVDIFEEASDTGPLDVPTRLLRREEAATLDTRFQAALAENPGDADLIARYAQFLTVGRHDHDGAEHHFERAIDADPQNEAVLRLFAAFLTDIRRDHDRAEDCYRLAIRANFNSATTMCAYAEFLWRARGDVETAAECFQVAVDSAPRDVDALTRYARFLSTVQRNDDAAFALLKLAASSATTPGPHIALAEFMASRRGDIEKAEAILEKALQIADVPAAASVAAARFHATYKGDLDRSEALFERALATDPESTDAMLAYAAFLQGRRADPKRAEALLQRATESDPSSAAIASAYARFRDEVILDGEGAEDMFRKAINLDPRDATALTHYGRFLQYSRRKPNAAEDRLRKAVAMEPRNAFALRSYGTFLLRERENTEDAEKLLRRALKVAPADAEVLADLADYLSKYANQREEAEEMYRRAVAAEPGHKRILRNYARFISDVRGDADAADALYSQVLAETPGDAKALCGSAHAHFVQGRHQEGLGLLERAFDAAMGDEPQRRDIDLLLELWFYRYAFDRNVKRDAIKATIWLVKEGAKVTRVDLGPVVSRAVSDDHPDPDILRELARVVSGGAEPERLERFDVA